MLRHLLLTMHHIYCWNELQIYMQTIATFFPLCKNLCTTKFLVTSMRTCWKSNILRFFGPFIYWLDCMGQVALKKNTGLQLQCWCEELISFSLKLSIYLKNYIPQIQKLLDTDTDDNTTKTNDVNGDHITTTEHMTVSTLNGQETIPESSLCRLCRVHGQLVTV